MSSDTIHLLLGQLLGLVSALGAFEFTEWRRRRQENKRIRAGVVAELQWLENVLASATIQHAYGSVPDKQAIDEYRRHAKAGLATGKFGEGAQGLLDQSDEVIGYLLQSTPAQTGNLPVRFPTQVLDFAAGSGLKHFSEAEANLISQTLWYLHMLETEAGFMEKYFDWTFELQGPNHDVAVQNHESARRGYRNRIPIALDAVRRTVAKLEGSEDLE